MVRQSQFISGITFLQLSYRICIKIISKSSKPKIFLDRSNFWGQPAKNCESDVHDNNGISPNTNTYVKLNMMVMNSTQFCVQPGSNRHISSPSRHQHMPFSMRASWRRPRGNSRDQTAHSRMEEKQAKAFKIYKWSGMYTCETPISLLKNLNLNDDIICVLKLCDAFGQYFFYMKFGPVWKLYRQVVGFPFIVLLCSSRCICICICTLRADNHTWLLCPCGGRKRERGKCCSLIFGIFIG